MVTNHVLELLAAMVVAVVVIIVVLNVFTRRERDRR